MWSGPRNISTAMLRSWGSRHDTVVVDEPLYAHYLLRTGLDHPGRVEVLASQENDWRVVVDQLIGEIPEGRRYYYQKHMAHHLLPNIDRDWIDRLTHGFLIRDPYEMLTSLIKVTPHPTLEDTGLPQQWELFSKLRHESEVAPVVLDAQDVLTDPAGMLRQLCERLELPFEEAMLSWQAGPRNTDGVWAKHWYAAVEASTGFQPYRPKSVSLPPALKPLLNECMKYYERLYEARIRNAANPG
jgi:hypothetical protein